MKQNKYNFDVQKMIEVFDFETFFKQDDEEVHDAFILVTDSQAIIGYTRDYGKGYHFDAFANALRVVRNLPLLTFFTSRRLDNIASKSCICAHLLSGDELDPSLYFDLSKVKSITANQLLLMITFVEKYNRAIRAYSKKTGNHVVDICTKDGKIHHANDLVPLIGCLKELVDYQKEVNLDKKIISDINIMNIRSDNIGKKRLKI